MIRRVVFAGMFSVTFMHAAAVPVGRKLPNLSMCGRERTFESMLALDR